ncbi:MAG: HD domain-containing protein [Solirubrobacterales bacterium]
MITAGEEAIVARLEGAEPVGELRRRLGAAATETWIVGGTIRDAALGRDLIDFDLATAADPRRLARGLASELGADIFGISSDFETWRVLADGWQADISPLRGPEIVADLGERDLTVNAIAMSLAGEGEVSASGSAPVSLIDPHGGLADLDAGVMRAVSDRSFTADPLRLLRLGRFASQFGLTVEPETEALARAAAPRAAEPAGERQFTELRRLICGPDPLAGLALCERLGLTAVVLPELDALHGIAQSGNHHLDTYDHTIEVLRRWLVIEANLSDHVGDAAPAVSEAISEPLADELSRREGIRFSAVWHDVGKPATRTEREGWVSFKGHDRVGAEMIETLCRRLKTSRRFAAYQASLCRHHLTLGFMVKDRPLAPRRTWEYLAACGPEALDVTLLTIADRLSAQGGGVPPEAIEGHLELAAEMAAAAVEVERGGAPPPLLRGGEIVELCGIEPGPTLGLAVAELAAAQYAGEVGGREGAVAHLREWAAGRGAVPGRGAAGGADSPMQ